MCFKSSIVIAADSWFGSTTFGVAQGFRRLGFEVVEVSQSSSFIQGRSLIARVIGRLSRPINIAIYNKEILQAVDQLNAKVFLTVKGNNIKPETLKILASRGVKTVNYYPDFRFTYESVDRSTFPLYSAFITTKSFQVEALEKLMSRDKVHFLHHGYCSDVHQPPKENSLNVADVPDVLYVGTYTTHKEKLFSELIKACPDVRFKIYGNGWSHSKCSAELINCLADRPIYAMNYAQLVSSAKINLAIHMGAADDSGWQDLVSTRSFELPACRGFMLHADNAEIRQLYDVGQEIDVFTAVDDLAQKIRFYLAHEQIRLQMVEKAYQRCVPAYSYDQRAIEIAALIEP
ncbi:glycosyltransferase [Methylotenera sp.]|uniref:CgeB family protein n=1 Tax=Methylotenera sp. TaxID=2051956 RepID=UPI002487FA72|nr:glycosyltransferase [Methylotenera sp.]MDI1299020.1 glycosyltransferase [Methylotenera sp.]